MQRRLFVIGSVGVLAGLSGCSGILGGSGDGGDADGADEDGGKTEGPDAVVESFFKEIMDGNPDAANELIHEDGDIRTATESESQQYQEENWAIEGTEVIEAGEATATVEITLSFDGQSGDRQTSTIRFELRTQEGAWRLYANLTDSEGIPAAPAVEWETAERTVGEGEVTAVEFEHQGGDTIPFSTLSVDAGGTAEAPSDTDAQVSAGSVVVAQFADGEYGHDATTGVDLLWTDPDSGQSRELVMHSLEDHSTGELLEELQLEQ